MSDLIRNILECSIRSSAEIRTPTLVVYGEDDEVTGAQMSRTLIGSLPNARLQVIARCGHAPQIEQPAAFAECIKAFLAGPAG